jgi:hypothetical protein
MVGGGGFIVRVKVAVPVPPALVAFRITENVPTADGIPLINPVEVSTASVAGKPVASKLPGELSSETRSVNGSSRREPLVWLVSAGAI